MHIRIWNLKSLNQLPKLGVSTLTLHLILSIKCLSLLISKNIRANLTSGGEYFWGKRCFWWIISFRLWGLFNRWSENEERDILNSSKDPLKSSKIIMLWSWLVTLFGSCFNYAKKSRISKLPRKGLAVLVTMICENEHENKWSS